MTISVILPVYNGEKYIADAVKSVLNQTFTDFELIVLNDGSTDTSLSIIEEFKDKRIVVVNQENQGLARTLNNGLRIAKGKYIARMDADDICLPNRFEEQIKHLEENPEVKLLGSAVMLIDADGNDICVDVPYTGGEFLRVFMLKVGNPFKHPTIIASADVLRACGGFNELIGKYFEDYFLWSRIADNYKVDILPKVLLKYRITPGSIMSSIKSPEFSNFMLGIINKKEFTLEDRQEMLRIKAHEGGQSVDKDWAYQKRIRDSRKLKINRLYVLLEKVFNIPVAMKIAVYLKKKKNLK